MAFWVNGKSEGEKLDVECTAGIAGQGLPLCRMPAKKWSIWFNTSQESMCLLLSRGTTTAVGPKGLCVDAQAGTSNVEIFRKKSIYGDRMKHTSVEQGHDYSPYDSGNKPNSDCSYIQQKEL